MKDGNKHNNGFKGIMSGDILLRAKFSKYMKVIIIITVLLVVYIASRYNIEKTIRDIDRLSTENKELQKHSLRVKTRYQSTTRMINIESKITETGVKISKEPIKDIIITKDSIK